MSTVPYAPLLLSEINNRVRDLESAITWTVADTLAGGRDLESWQLDRLRALSSDVIAYHDAAMVRLPRTIR